MSNDSKADEVINGTVREVDGKMRIYYDQYWIRYYQPPDDVLTAKKNLIVGLTRRAFHHTELGINTPGENLDLARLGYERAAGSAEKRVNAAMLAGALFNRATDIFKTVVELAEKGVHISLDNELMRECSECLQEAMELGQWVRDVNGDNSEGIEELWGEPLKAFTLPLGEYYASRYIKISQSMRDIDNVAEKMIETFNSIKAFEGIEDLLRDFVKMAKQECEITKIDPDIFEVWPKYVTSIELVEYFEPQISNNTSEADRKVIERGSELLQNGRKLIEHIAGVRVPIPKATKRYIKDCDEFAGLTENLEE